MAGRIQARLDSVKVVAHIVQPTAGYSCNNHLAFGIPPSSDRRLNCYEGSDDPVDCDIYTMTCCVALQGVCRALMSCMGDLSHHEVVLAGDSISSSPISCSGHFTFLSSVLRKG